MHIMSGGAKHGGVLMLASLRTAETVDEESTCVCKPSVGETKKTGDRDPTALAVGFLYIKNSILSEGKFNSRLTVST
jgi:hypothetical protein